MKISRLALIAFVGIPIKNQEACHLDGNPENNKLSNLKWDLHITVCKLKRMARPQ